MPNQVVMTVVQPRPMFIRASVPEEQLHYSGPDLKGIATPTGYPDLKIAGDGRRRQRRADRARQLRRAAEREARPQDQVAHARHDLQSEAGSVSEEGCHRRAAEGRPHRRIGRAETLRLRCWTRTASRSDAT